MASGMKSVGKALGTAAKKTLTTSAKPSISNLYSSVKVSKAVGIGIGAAGVGMGLTRMSDASTDLHNNDAAYFNEVDNLSFGARTQNTAPAPMASGSAPSILAGGQAPASAGQADNLGATGDMVFGMHNKRNG